MSKTKSGIVAVTVTFFVSAEDAVEVRESIKDFYSNHYCEMEHCKLETTRQATTHELKRYRLLSGGLREVFDLASADTLGGVAQEIVDGKHPQISRGQRQELGRLLTVFGSSKKLKFFLEFDY